jgi:hypothetical protein
MAESSQPVQIDAALLLRYVEALGTLGWPAEGGIVRPVVYSATWMQAREQLASWMCARIAGAISWLCYKNEADPLLLCQTRSATASCRGEAF